MSNKSDAKQVFQEKLEENTEEDLERIEHRYWWSAIAAFMGSLIGGLMGAINFVPGLGSTLFKIMLPVFAAICMGISTRFYFEYSRINQREFITFNEWIRVFLFGKEECS